VYFDICPKRKQGQGPKMEGLSYTGLVFEGFSCLTKQGQGFKPLAHGIYTQTWGKHGSSAPLPPPLPCGPFSGKISSEKDRSI